MVNTRCRIGKVRYKNGLTVLPSLPKRRADEVFIELERGMGFVREYFAEDLAGFVLIPFNHDGAHMAHIITRASRPQLNDLPTWTAEVLRRDAAERDSQRMIRKTLGIE